MSYNKNKVKLHVDTDFDDSIEDISNSNQLRFKTYVNRIVIEQNIQDFIIRLSMITGLFLIACPQFFAELHFLNDTNETNTNIENNYLKVSILEQFVLSGTTYYFIMGEDLDSIYYIKYGTYSMPKLIFIGKIEKVWYKYYSWLGIIITAIFYFRNGYLTSVYMYIFYLSIFRLSVFRFLQL